MTFAECRTVFNFNIIPFVNLKITSKKNIFDKKTMRNEKKRVEKRIYECFKCGEFSITTIKA